MNKGPDLTLAANYYLAPAGYGVARFMAQAKAAGADAVGLTLAALDECGPHALARLASDHGLKVSSLNSAGYFLFSDPNERDKQSERSRRLIEAAAEMKAGRLVVIAGGIAGSGLTLEQARSRVGEELARLDTEAAAAGVRLALEPIHPADVTTKGCINSVDQALACIAPLSSTDIVIDIFHSAWDPAIWRQEVLGNPRLAFVQVCDWYEPSADEKPQRDMPGLGCMDLKGWLRTLRVSDFAGVVEFELFDRHRRGRPVETILNESLAFLRDAGKA